MLRELWTKEVEDPEVRNTYQYVADLKERLEATCKMARANLDRSSERYRNYNNKGARERQMTVGEKIIFYCQPPAISFCNERDRLQLRKNKVCEKVRKMLEAGVIESSDSPYCSPIVILKKGRHKQVLYRFPSNQQKYCV